ncbi:MAG: isoleucyl-tRNA synthetase, isoleucyl-tRNA synthetase [Parcubacteria group bacterium]|nr:isoleucyl-tRNA synthetase, isoleucyl-tRNA synthetase [Parcubacteria group bacterium]
MADIDTDQVEKSDAAKREEEILAFWQTHNIAEKARARGSEKKPFIFYEGPPTANGRPGVHHMESRSFKDAIPRYKTMQGFHVPRRAGWDTHGLPVELEVEKQLGFTGKQDIEAYGIAAFNKKCRESVFNYIHEWERFSERLGYWADQKKAYFTFNAPYMETLFSIVKKIEGDGRLYKDYKVLPWCVKCGTALSSHELAQGYEDVKDLSLTAKFELVDEPGTFVLAWTTTPWTLPGNVGLAVGEKIEYGVYEKDGERVIVANALAQKVLGEEWKKIAERPAVDLIGKKYQALYPFAQALAPETEKGKFENAFQIYAADFVNTEDGTGIVHTAVMYGQDDFELGQKVGLPKVHLVAPDGTFIPGTGYLEGKSVIDAETNVEVLKDLQARGLLFSKETYTHSYPHCWRSKNRLIYYARDSWFIRMTDLRETLLSENAKVRWEPEHIRDGRMGEWLANARDWAISRERYWGTPLPVWQNEDGTERLVIGSVDELKQRTKKSGNAYFVMRHAEAEQNVKRIVNSGDLNAYGLTEAGKAQAQGTGEQLQKEKITHIYASPFRRARESAELIADAIGIPQAEITYDARLRELDFGDLNEHSYDEFLAYRKEHLHAYSDTLPNGESWLDARRRFGHFIYELESTHQNENILIITHGIAFESLLMIVEGKDHTESQEFLQTFAPPQKGSWIQLDFVPLPHNEDYELDLHRPYIDEIVLLSDAGTELHRVKEVMDVWFDSGAMPFAQDHYPFENKDWIETKGYPADFISEAIDQTRGWFYTLLAVGVLMGKGSAYKNVICLGHLLDEQGLKMSKSKGNIIEPMAAMERYGADTLRFWMYSVNQPGDSKNFDDKTVKEAARVISWFENSVKFYELFKDAEAGKGKEQIIDTWMRTRVSETIAKATSALDAYDLYAATRSIAALVEDLSQWYVRRVRERVREGDAAALTTLRDTLQAIAVLLAPFTPFVAEWAYQAVREDTDPESVHLADWYEAGTVDTDLIENMQATRVLASDALRVRQAAGIKVRQPLASLSIPGTLPNALAELLAEEVNVKEIIMKQEALSLATSLTPELVRDGDIREFARALADARKVLGLSPRDTVSLTVSENGAALLAGVELAGVSALAFGPADAFVAETSTGPVHFSLRPDAA